MFKVQKQHLSSYVVWILFIVAIAIMKFWYHELWKDEWQAWFVAKDKSVPEIFSFLYYEGHPSLWYLYLKMFTLFDTWVSGSTLINVAHLLTVVAGLYFLIVKFRLPLLYKILFSLSYFIFFEYGIVNRGYFLVILLLFWSVWLISKDSYKDKHLAILLFLLCQTEIYGVLMAISLGIYIFSCQRDVSTTSTKKAIFGIASGLLLFLLSVYPRTSGHIAKTANKDLSMSDQFLSAFQGNLSNTYLLGSTPDTFTYGWTTLGLILSLACLFGLWFVFKNNKHVLLSGGAFFLAMLAFSSLFYLGGIRQWGMGLVFMIALLELIHFNPMKERFSALIVGVFCIFNIVHNVRAVNEEIKIPFSNAKQTGLFIAEKVPAKVPVVAMNKFEATPVIGYAGRQFYELPTGTEFSYFRWVDKIYLPTESELKLFAKYKQVGGIILLSPKPIDGERFPSAQLWQKFDEVNFKKENYFIYTLPIQ